MIRQWWRNARAPVPEAGVEAGTGSHSEEMLSVPRTEGCGVFKQMKKGTRVIQAIGEGKSKGPEAGKREALYKRKQDSKEVRRF